MTPSSRTLSVQHSRAVTGPVLAVQVRDTLSLLPPTTLTAASPNLLPRARHGSSGERALSQHSPPRCPPSPPELTVSRCHVQCKRMPLRKMYTKFHYNWLFMRPRKLCILLSKVRFKCICFLQISCAFHKITHFPVRLCPHPCVLSHQLPFLRQVAVTFLVARSSEYLPLLRL